MALETFLKQNKKDTAKEVEFPASEAFVDADGKVMMWKLRPVKSREMEVIRSSVNSYKKNGAVEFDNASFNRKIAVACTVYPDLKNAELQNSYGVMGEEELIIEMLDNDGEYQKYVKKCLEISGYDESDADLVEEAKN